MMVSTRAQARRFGSAEESAGEAEEVMVPEGGTEDAVEPLTPSRAFEKHRAIAVGSELAQQVAISG